MAAPPIITRFAPSPTGRLHVGNIRTALLCWLCARKSGGRFLLRLDDTDAARSTEANAQTIRDDLAWLGLDPDAEFRQSDRFDRYEASFQALREEGRVYPAYESEEELGLKRKIALGRGLPPIYDRAALTLSVGERRRLEDAGITPHWRFKLDHGASVGWTDLVRGEQRFDPSLLSDPVIRRADGSWLYMLPSVIDDIELGVTHIVRGEDHVTNTALQLQMFEALAAPVPHFAHTALLTGADGKLSKRLGAMGADAFREAGIEPQALLALLARLGTSDPIEPVTGSTALIEGFDFAKLGRAPARFDVAELAALNARTLHLLPYEAVHGRLPVGMDAGAWDAIRPNLATMGDAADWWQVIEGPIAPPEPTEEDRSFLAAAAREAEALDWQASPWGALTSGLKQSTGRAGRALFLPLRRALTGREHGPEMAALLPLIGRTRAIERLRAAAH